MAPHIPRALGAYRKSYALLSSADKCDRLVVFVHGFGGKPTGTWRNFQSLVDDLQDKFPWWHEADLVFYYSKVVEQFRFPLKISLGTL